jgi:hypothetical protein
MRRKRERGPELPPEAGATHRADETPPEATEASESPEQPPKRGGFKHAIKESLREAALRRTSTKR